VGKQIRFFMTREDEGVFIGFVRSTGNIAILPYTSPSPSFPPVGKLPEPSSTKFWADFWLHNRDTSPEPATDFLSQQGYYVIDESRSEVIEFSRTVQEGSVLRPGRLWVEFKFLDETGIKLLPKGAEFKNWYESLARWIRRNYSREVDPDYYVAPDALRLIKEDKVRLEHM
jgi:hypothetical protein